MNTSIFFLVIFASVIHAFWNLLAKKSQSPELVICLSKVTEVVLFLAPFIYFFADNPYGLEDLKWVLGASVLVALNYIFLTKSYAYLDMSIAYPITRCSTLFLPVIAYLLVGERLNTTGYLAMGLVTLGVLTIQLHAYSRAALTAYLQALRSKGFLYALLTALTLATYTVWDKLAVTNMQPFLYFYSYTVFTMILLLIVNSKKYTVADMKSVLKREYRSIVLIGLCNTGGYLLILYAFTQADVSIVGTLRQTSLVFGFIFGYFWLAEAIRLPRLVSLVLIITGSVLISFA